MLSFTDYLSERLKDSYNIKKAKDIIGDDVISSNKGTRTTHDLISLPHKDVKEHLNSHGLDISNINSGYIKD